MGPPLALGPIAEGRTLESLCAQLTCITYTNPEWQQAHGGELRLHLASGVRDVPPLDGRLILFWSDNRCPHEVMPSYKERFAVSLWFSDAAAAAKAEATEAAAPARPQIYVTTASTKSFFE